MTERDYDNLYNEGAVDGFNPYRKDFDDGEPAWSKVESRLSKIQLLLNGIGDSEFDAARKTRLMAEQVELKALFEAIK
jgi:hypothetical protein